MTDRTKFKIYVRGGGKLKVKAKVPRSPKPKNPSSVAFVLRHISGKSYDEQRREADRLMSIVEMSTADRLAIEQILQSRCQKSQ